ncbi:hypothetical protein RV02_GL001483 [Enterococcus gilvus]|nr:hypothetical protein RV02_GL001483 [Enterococcus gilvus]
MEVLTEIFLIVEKEAIEKRLISKSCDQSFFLCSKIHRSSNKSLWFELKTMNTFLNGQ